MAAQKFAVPVGSSVPTHVLHKGIVCTKVHAHGSAAVRAVGNKLGRDISFQDGILRYGQLTIRCNDIPLRFHHLPDKLVVVIRFLTAWFTALEQTVITLCIEQPFLSNPAF